MSELTVGALDRVLELVVLITDDMTRSLEAAGLTVARTQLLWQLGLIGASTQQTLADAMRVSARNVTGLVDGLVRTGFVSRQPHPSDRRATLVTVTEHGSAVLAQLRREQLGFADELFAGLTDEQLRGLTSGLDQVLLNLRAALEAAG